MSVVKREPEDSALANIKKEAEVNNIKHEVKQEKDGETQNKVRPGTHLCTCNHTAKDGEDKPKPKFNARKFHRIYVEWDPGNMDVPENRQGLVTYFSNWGPVQHSWIKLNEGLACIEYRGSQSVTKVQLARPHGQTRTRRCHPKYYPAVRNVLFLAQDIPEEDTPALSQHLAYFGEVIHFASHFIRERNLHLIFVTFQDYDSVDCLMLKLFLRMGSWKFYVSAVKGTVSLGADGFPERYREPGSADWEDFAKQIPENLPPVAAAQKTTAAPNSSENCSNSCPAITVINSSDNLAKNSTRSSNANVSTNIISKSNKAPTPVPGSSTSTAIVDDEIEVVEIPRDPPELIDLTEEDSQSNGDTADILVEFVGITRKNADVTAGAEEDEIIFLGEAVRHCRKCGGKIIVITLD